LLIVGISHAALGNNEDARKILSEYLQINPKNKFVEKAFHTLQ
jgi:hypothetical protein